MKYHFNLKIQSLYGLIGIITTLGIIYLFTRKLDWISAMTVGFANFIIAGFYSVSKCR